MSVMYGKGIIAIPKSVREKAGIKEGAKLQIWADNGTIHVKEDVGQYLKEFEELCRIGREGTPTGKELEKRLKKAEERMRKEYLNVKRD